MAFPMMRVAPKVAASFSVAFSHSKVSSMSSSSSSVRVASYNVLSDSLSEPSHFFKCLPDDLDESVRFQRVTKLLKQEMDKGSVLCLQEVSRNWGGKLVPFFEENGYAYAGGPYGPKFNGYMGVCVAWPRDKHAVKDVKVESVVDSVQWVKKPDWECPACKAFCFGSRSHCYKCNTVNPAIEVKAADPVVATSPLGIAARIAGFLAVMSWGAAPVKMERPKPVWETWPQVARKMNTSVLVRLSEKTSGKDFVVGTYHMPCLFGSDEKCQVMVAHVSLLMKQAQRFAGKDPLVVAGDFNMQPDTQPYQVAVTGTLDQSDPQHPPMPAPITSGWTLNAKPMRSAYQVANGQEPTFTNFAWSKFDKNEAFVGTLDYIFISEDWEVTGTKDIDAIPTDSGFPSKLEPSDHVLVAADLHLSK